MIQTIFKSEKDKTELVSFHIGNNEKFIESLKKNNMLIIYNESSLISPELEILIEKKTIGKNLIATFSDKSYEFIKNNEIKEKEGDQFKWGNYAINNKIKKSIMKTYSWIYLRDKIFLSRKTIFFN